MFILIILFLVAYIYISPVMYSLLCQLLSRCTVRREGRYVSRMKASGFMPPTLRQGIRGWACHDTLALALAS